MSMNNCRIIDFPVIADSRGNLTFIEENKHIPFEIKRVYYLYDVPSGETRGGHAHKNSEQIIIALSGSFRVILDDGTERKMFFLNRPHYGLYITKGIWRELEDFSSNSIALTLTSTLFDEEDYIREYNLFKEIARKKKLSKVNQSANDLFSIEELSDFTEKKKSKVCSKKSHLKLASSGIFQIVPDKEIWRFNHIKWRH